MSHTNVTVTVNNFTNGLVSCSYNPPGPYNITTKNQKIIFTLDANSVASGWQYNGYILSFPAGQLSISGSGNSVTVTDTDSVSGIINYNLGMAQNKAPAVWSDPQNNNTAVPPQA